VPGVGLLHCVVIEFDFRGGPKQRLSIKPNRCFDLSQASGLVLIDQAQARSGGQADSESSHHRLQPGAGPALDARPPALVGRAQT
jgi:hypothetical protein